MTPMYDRAIGRFLSTVYSFYWFWRGVDIVFRIV
jgi:hypothetical protein